MKILQVITLSDIGGAQSVVVSLANKLIEEHEVIVVAGDGDGKMFDLLNQNVKQEKLPHLQRTVSLRNDIRTIFDMKKIYKKYRPDIIHLHSSKAGILGRIAFPSKKVIYTVHGFDSIRVAYRNFLPIERIMQIACKSIVGVSEYDCFWMKKEKITRNVSVIYNGIQKPIITKKISFPIPDKFKKIVLCIARMSSPKRSDIFMEVAEKLPEYAFVWIGNQTEVKDHPKNTFFLGNVPNAGKYCSICDLFILPSNYEGLPMVILESMSFGIPVVASNVGGIKEIVLNDWNGYVVDNNVSLFVEKIRYILENEDVYNKFSRNAIERFNRDLIVDKMVNSYLDIYNK